MRTFHVYLPDDISTSCKMHPFWKAYESKAESPGLISTAEITLLLKLAIFFWEGCWILRVVDLQPPALKTTVTCSNFFSSLILSSFQSITAGTEYYPSTDIRDYLGQSLVLYFSYYKNIYIVVLGMYSMRQNGSANLPFANVALVNALISLCQVLVLM